MLKSWFLFLFTCVLLHPLTAEDDTFTNIAEQKKDNKPSGIGLPQSILYPTQLANPRQVVFACGIRLNDSVAGKVSSPVTFGMQFPVYRWLNIDLLTKTGDLQFDIEGAVFGIFNQASRDNTLINTEYYIALPLTYAHYNWAHRIRIFHVSSHLGDEYVKTHKNVKRINKSYEAIDYSLSYCITKAIRLYAGPGAILHSDSEMLLKPLYVEYGMDIHFDKQLWKEMYGRPFFSMYFENAQDTHWNLNATFAVGYELGRVEKLGRKARLTLEYHNGYSEEGQFSRKRNSYVQFGLSYGF